MNKMPILFQHGVSIKIHVCSKKIFLVYTRPIWPKKLTETKEQYVWSKEKVGH